MKITLKYIRMALENSRVLIGENPHDLFEPRVTNGGAQKFCDEVDFLLKYIEKQRKQYQKQKKK